MGPDLVAPESRVDDPALSSRGGDLEIAPSAQGSRIPRAFFLVLCLVSPAATFHAAIGSQTQAGPSPNALFQFQKENRSHPWLHITADSGMVERKVLRIDPLGLHGLSTPDGARLPESITWDQVDRIEMRGGSALQGAAIGGATFGAVGALLGMAVISVADGSWDNVGLGAVYGVLYVAPVGIVLGGLSGTAVRRWVTVYRRH